MIFYEQFLGPDDLIEGRFTLSRDKLIVFLGDLRAFTSEKDFAFELHSSADGMKRITIRTLDE